MADTLKVRPRPKVLPKHAQRYLRKSISRVDAPDAFQCADVLARADGVFVVRIAVAPEFSSDDLDELAFAVCMAAKDDLGHLHDVHSPKVKRNASPRVWQSLGESIGDILVHYPIRLDGERGADIFKKKNFTDEDLQELCAYWEDDNSKRRARLSGGETSEDEVGRNALICLRRSFLKVFEGLAGALHEDREYQKRVERNMLYRALVGLALVLMLLTLSVAFLGWPQRISEDFWPQSITDLRWLGWIPHLVILLPTTFLFLYHLSQYLFWDRHRVRLLRSAETYFQYVNPLNAVIDRIMTNRVRASQSITDFKALQGILQIKTAGETHRASMRQFWMTITLSLVALYFAALAIRDSTEQAVRAAAPGMSLASLDCGWPSPRAVGPFPLGAWDRVEEQGSTPADVMNALWASNADREITTLVLLGSTDEHGVRTESVLASNSDLARRRALWVAQQVREGNFARGASISVYTLNETIPFARAQFDAETSGREVFVCVN